MRSFAPFLSFLVVFLALPRSDLVSGHSIAPASAGHFHHNEAAHRRHGKIAASHAQVANSTADTELEKRAGSAQFTHFVAGLGACGGVNSDSDFIVALNAQQWDGGASCYKTITVTYNGKSTQAQIVDRCLGCGWNNLDLSDGLFKFFGDPGVGVLVGDWSYGTGEPTVVKASPTPTPTPTPTSTIPASTTSSSTTKIKSASSTTTKQTTTLAATSKISSTVSSSTVVSSTAAIATPTVGPGFLDQVNALTFNLGEIIFHAASN